MEFFRNMSTPEMLKKIRQEVKETTEETIVQRGGVPRQTTRRGRSKLLLDDS
jgi:hypothetical protein